MEEDTNLQHDKIEEVEITKQMQKSYLDYAMSVIVSRALPDVRDGLKPMQRRIIFSMFEEGMTHTSGFSKSAKVVGGVIAKYHPHGDQAVYHTMVRMAQDFTMRYPLITGQGNFGSVDGDSPAAMRYTESRLSAIAAELLVNIREGTVDFIDNYSGEDQEPTLLPTILPNLLLNGSAGIAVGMATNIPPHNLGEVVGALLSLIEKGNAILPIEQKYAPFDESVDTRTSFDSEATVEDLLEHIQGPDFPTKAQIYDIQQIRQVYTTGKGAVLMRAVTDIEEMKNGKSAIIVTELPYQVNKAVMVEKIADLVKKEKIKGISDLRDESDRQGMRVVIELKREARPQRILNQLYKSTELQKTFNANMVALVHGEPMVLTLKSILIEFVRHRQQVVIRRTLFILQKAREREHILEGLMIALNHLDEVIETIKKSSDADVAKTNLMEKFKLSELQSLAILEMQLRRLAALEQQKIKDELAEIKQKIAEYLKLLANPEEVLKTISTELKDLKEKYGDKRKTVVFKKGLKDFTEEDLVQAEDVIVTLTENGYIKRLDSGTYKTQLRGGKGIKGMQTKEEDMVAHLLIANTHDRLLFFTNKGKVYSLATHEIPEASRTAKGTALVNLIDCESGEYPKSILKLSKTDTAKYLFFATIKGQVKRTPLTEFENIRKSGKIAITLKTDDELSWVSPTSGEDEILLVTKKGQSIRFKETDCREMGRGASGVRGVLLKKSGDGVVGMEIVRPKTHMLVASVNGYGKLTAIENYSVQHRGGSGVMTASVTEKTGDLVAGRMIIDTTCDLLMTSTSGQIIRLSCKNVPKLGRATQGVRLIKLNSGDFVGAVTVLDEEAVLPEETGVDTIKTAEETVQEELEISEEVTGDSATTEIE